MLDIYRVGYAKDDKKDVPFATVELDKNVNFDEFHCLKIVVDGDKAFTYLDEKPVDVPETAMGPMKNFRPRAESQRPQRCAHLSETERDRIFCRGR